MQKNVALNQLGAQVDLRSVAAGAEPGTPRFSLGTPTQTGWGGFTNSPDENSVAVEVVTLDSVVSRDEVVQVLKIDLEGADTWVLYGARQLLEEKRVQNIFFEENGVRMAALNIPPGTAQRFLESVDYRVCQISGGFVRSRRIPRHTGGLARW